MSNGEMGNSEQRQSSVERLAAEFEGAARQLERRQALLETRRRGLGVLAMLYDDVRTGELQVGAPKFRPADEVYPAQTITYLEFAHNRNKSGFINRLLDTQNIFIRYTDYSSPDFQAGDYRAGYVVDFRARENTQPAVTLREYIPQGNSSWLSLNLGYATVDGLVGIIESTPPSFYPAAT